MRAILYYVAQPMPGELHGLERSIYADLSQAEAQILMRVPAVREPGAALESVEFRDRVFNRHEDNRVLIHSKWGITDVYVVNRRSYVSMLLPAEDLAALESGDA